MIKHVPILFLALSSCGPLPERDVSYVLPIERGAPARIVDPQMKITILDADPRELLANHRYAGAVVIDGECVVLMPKGAPAAIRERLLAHELRHCAGQEHTVSYNEVGRPIDHWSP